MSCVIVPKEETSCKRQARDIFKVNNSSYMETHVGKESQRYIAITELETERQRLEGWEKRG